MSDWNLQSHSEDVHSSPRVPSRGEAVYWLPRAVGLLLLQGVLELRPGGVPLRPDLQRIYVGSLVLLIATVLLTLVRGLMGSSGAGFLAPVTLALALTGDLFVASSIAAPGPAAAVVAGTCLLCWAAIWIYTAPPPQPRR